MEKEEGELLEDEFVHSDVEEEKAEPEEEKAEPEESEYEDVEVEVELEQEVDQPAQQAKLT